MKNPYEVLGVSENATDEDFNKFLLENVYLTENAYRYINENSLMSSS